MFQTLGHFSRQTAGFITIALTSGGGMITRPSAFACLTCLTTPVQAVFFEIFEFLQTFVDDGDFIHVVVVRSTHDDDDEDVFATTSSFSFFFFE